MGMKLSYFPLHHLDLDSDLDLDLDLDLDQAGQMHLPPGICILNHQFQGGSGLRPNAKRARIRRGDGRAPIPLCDLMSQALPNINETVEVMIEDGGERTRSSSRIYDTSKGLIQLFWPTREGVRVPVARDRRITLVYHRESGIYECPGVVAEISQDPVPIIHLRPQGKVDRIQRREYVRVKASIPVLMHEAHAAAETSKASETAVFRISARTVDLSGGGMCILKELSVPIGSVFQVRLMLEEDEAPLELVARIVSVARTQDTYGRNLFRMGIEFTGIPDAKRKIIVRKVFKIQQENAARSTGKPGDSPHYETKK